jgi:hypothetical protein
MGCIYQSYIYIYIYIMNKIVLITTVAFLSFLSNNETRKTKKIDPIISPRHYPFIDLNNNLTYNKPHPITDPEMSKAFYNELNGEPHYYIIDSDKKFKFYCGILVPLTCPSTEVYFEVYNDDQSIHYITSNSKDGTWKITASDNAEEKYKTTGKWNKWYEKHAKGFYWNGPELGKEYKSTMDFLPGKYIIKVYNTKNKGKYSLAVGDKEDILGFIFKGNEIKETVKKVQDFLENK